MMNRGRKRQGNGLGCAALALGLLFTAPGDASAADEGTKTSVVAEIGEPLELPYEITPTGATLTTELDAKFENLYVPTWEQDAQKCYNPVKSMHSLRTYGYRHPGASGCESNFCYGYPGPTYRMRRTVADTNGVVQGAQYNLTLTNNLDVVPLNETMECSADGVRYTADDGPGHNCFHGGNVTNHHFHGFHTSPNPNTDGTSYSDYVYVKVYPNGTQGVTESFPDAEVGTANYRLEPLSVGQHEGTHWYHPHKHGATALQVGNGMAGTFIVEGPYDDWVKEEVCAVAGGACELKEQVLVVQEILTDFVFPPQSGEGAAGLNNSAALVNGQLYPTLEIAPGEVQRWRVVNATMKAGSAFYIKFPAELEVRQIGLDGVPFVEENYARQPLLGAWDGTNCNIPTDGEEIVLPEGTTCTLLHPGNRGDFLVQRKVTKRRAMKKAAKKRKASGERLEVGASSLIHSRPFFSQSIRERRPAAVTTRRKSTKTCEFPNKPGLFQLNSCIGGGAACTEQDMQFPSTASYPPLSSLGDIPDVPADKKRTIPFKIAGYAGSQFPVPSESSDPGGNALFSEINAALLGDGVDTCNLLLPQFTIEDKKFEAGTVDQTMVVNTAEEWTFQNQAAAPDLTNAAAVCPALVDYIATGEPCSTASVPSPCLSGDIAGQGTVTAAIPVPNPIQHPVHLHVNPFQVISSDDGRKGGAPYVWQDVMGLNLTSGNAVMKTKFVEITGEYVMHCHILGHEDRGMMQNLEVVSAND